MARHSWKATKQVTLSVTDEYPTEKTIAVAWACVHCGLAKRMVDRNKVFYTAADGTRSGRAGRCGEPLTMGWHSSIPAATQAAWAASRRT